MREAMQLVPMVIEHSSRDERSFDIYSRLLRERIIFLNRQADDTVAALVCAQLRLIRTNMTDRNVAFPPPDIAQRIRGDDVDVDPGHPSAVLARPVAAS